MNTQTLSARLFAPEFNLLFYSAANQVRPVHGRMTKLSSL